MKLVLTHKGLDVDKSGGVLVIPVQAESVDVVRGHFALIAESALRQGRDSFEVYGHSFKLQNVLPAVRPELELRLAVNARNGLPMPKLLQGPQGRRHIYRGATVQTLEDWFASNQKYPGTVMRPN